MDFLNKVEKQEEVQLVLDKLANKRPDIDLSEFGFAFEQELPELEPTEFIPFVNRKEELERVLYLPNGPYYLFDAPPGYGKTSLLERIEKAFKDLGWFCVYVSLEKYRTLSKIIDHLKRELGIACQFYPHNIKHTGEVLGREIAKKRKNERGLVLLFDVDHGWEDDYAPVLDDLIHNLIPSIWDGLTNGQVPQHFRREPNSYRVIIAGRSLSTKLHRVSSGSPLFSNENIIRLKPFTYGVAQHICTNYLQDEQSCNDFAAHLLFHTGGHPSCMVRALELFNQAECNPDDFWTNYRDKIYGITFAEMNSVRNGIPREHRRIINMLCLYRRLDKTILRESITDGLIEPEIAQDVPDLVRKLVSKSLLELDPNSAFQHLTDDITRKLLAIQLRLDISDQEFRRDCLKARNLYLRHLEASTDFRHLWAIEVLYEYLMANVKDICDSENRRALRTNFFCTELPFVLQHIPKNSEPSLEYESLERILKNDEEFQFTVNYFLRDDGYNNSMYIKMLNIIEQYFDDRSLQQEEVIK